MNRNKRLWVVGRLNSAEEIKKHSGHTWNFIGVCTTERDAIDACKDADYFIGPVRLDKMLPHEIVEWVGCYYPKGTK